MELTRSGYSQVPECNPSVAYGQQYVDSVGQVFVCTEDGWQNTGRANGSGGGGEAEGGCLLVALGVVGFLALISSIIRNDMEGEKFHK